jgi:hypothetical protein
MNRALEIAEKLEMAEKLKMAEKRAAVFRRAGDRALRSSAWWLAREMLEMDWVERHVFYNQMVRTKPKKFVTMLQMFMSPHDLLKGSGTSREAPTWLVMGDKPGKRQMKIEEFFVAKRPR